MELGIVYELVGPDGTRIAFGNTDVAKADPDYVGWLEEAGIAGLDSPDVREVATDRAGAHGGIQYDNLHGRRPIVVNGQIDPNGLTIGQIIAREQKVKRACNAMRAAAPALLKWTNTGYPKRRLSVYRQSPPRITGRRLKAFQLALVDSDYRILSDVENATAAGIAVATGQAITNAGDEDASWRVVINGPTAGVLRVDIAGVTSVRFKAGFTLAAGQVLEVDSSPPYPIVELDGVNVYGQVDWLLSPWLPLPPGVANLRVNGTAGTGTWQGFWRDAWI